MLSFSVHHDRPIVKRIGDIISHIVLDLAGSFGQKVANAVPGCLFCIFAPPGTRYCIWYVFIPGWFLGTYCIQGTLYRMHASFCCDECDEKNTYDVAEVRGKWIIRNQVFSFI